MDIEELHHRHSIRLKGFNYSDTGYYFVTICTHDRECLFGEIKNGEMIFNDYGKIIENVWYSLPKHHNVKLDEFQIMPNHIHFILIIPLGRGIARNAPTFKNVTTGSLPCIVRSFKSEITKQIHQLGYNRRVWQRNYYEHIIRNEREYWEIKKYIKNNPKNWENDRNNQENW
jgi:putative transposase